MRLTALSVVGSAVASPDGVVHILRAGVSRIGLQAFPGAVQAHLFVQLHSELLPAGRSVEINLAYEVSRVGQEKPLAEVHGVLVHVSPDDPIVDEEEAVLALAMPLGFLAPAAGRYNVAFSLDGEQVGEVSFVVHGVDANLQPLRPE